jgi:transcriptional regulator with XRE-family HTH domain
MADCADQDWHLKEWAAARGKKQADLVTELGWHSTTAHRLWHGKQPYRRDFVNEAARWLGIEPFELLMPPAEAIALKNIRRSALAIAAEDGAVYDPELEAPGRPAGDGSALRGAAARP